MPSANLSTGAVVHYVDSGPADADQTLVFSHGFLMDHRMFDGQVSELDADMRCIRWDERGHGETSDDGKQFSYWDSAADLLALLDDLEVERAVLVGMSQGGFLSLRAALLAPERVAGLILIDSQAGVELEDSRSANDTMHHIWMTQGATDELATVVASVIIGPGADAEPWKARWQSRPKESFDAPYRCLMDRDDITNRLGDVSCPVLVIHGTHDQAIPMERAEAVAAAVPDCRGIVRIAGGSHAANMTHPAEVNEAIRAFLEEL